jgi:hypothetical protein
MRTALIILLTLAIVLLTVAFLTYRTIGNKPIISSIHSNNLRDLETFIRTNETILSKHAELIMTGKIPQQQGSSSYPAPQTNNIEQRVSRVSLDPNQNVYFILTDSFTTFNVGFIYRKSDQPLLGDQQEPNLVTNIFLFNNWYFYKSR